MTDGRLQPAPSRRSLMTILLLVAVASLPAGLSADSGSAQTTSSYELVVSDRDDRGDARPLAGETFSSTAKVHVFTRPNGGVERVRFYLDDPTMSREPRHVENFAPYDFVYTEGDGTAAPLDLSTLSPGSHTITAAVEKIDGDTEVVSAAFRVGGESDPGQELVFEDDFQGTTLNSQWVPYYSAGNGGNGLRRPSAITLDGNGNLVISAKMVNGQLVSGGMNNRNRLTYGRFEFRVKTEPDPTRTMSGVVLTWPSSGNWPTEGENDMYETGLGRSSFYTFIHYDPTNKQYYYRHDADASQWHTIAMEWTASAIRIYRDGDLVWTLTDRAAIPDVAHHLAIQLDALAERTLTQPVRMLVDYVRIHRYR